MADLTELQNELREKRPVSWEELPDFALYMDQVLSYMDRQVIQFHEDDSLTAAMVNNYTKSGLVPRAEGKRYRREHLAYLTAISILKQVMSTRDMDLLIQEELRQGPDIPKRYEQFCESLDRSLSSAADQLHEAVETLSPADAAIRFALLSYAAGVVSNRCVMQLRQEKGETQPKAKRKSKKGDH